MPSLLSVSCSVSTASSRSVMRSPCVVGRIAARSESSFVAAEAVAEAAVLGHAALGDVHLGEHFEAADERRVNRLGQLSKRFEHTVDSELNEHDVLFGIDVDVGRAALEGDLP